MKTPKAIFWAMWRNVVRNRYISGDPHFSDFQIFFILTLSWSKQRKTFWGYDQFARDPKITGFSDLSGIEMAIRRSKNRSDGMLKKDVKFSYCNLCFDAYIKTTTESSKIVGPGTCQTRALISGSTHGFLRNIFCSDLSLIRCGYDYVTLCNVIIPTAN